MVSSAAARIQIRDYNGQIHRPLNCLIFITPLLLFFHLGTMYFGASNLKAPQHLSHLLLFFGGRASYWPAILVVATLLLQHMIRREQWRINSKAVAGIALESVAWTVPLVVMSMLTGRSLAAGVHGNASEIVCHLLVPLGAGIYEEFIFRLVLISLAMLFFVDVFGLSKDYVTVAAVLAGAVLFSLYHFTTFSQFNWGLCLFRALAGVFLGGLYVFRGFGVAVGVHAAFDMYVAARTM